MSSNVIFSPFILNARQKEVKLIVLCSEVARCLKCQSDGYTKKNVNNCFFHPDCAHFVIFLPFSLNVKNLSIRPSFTGEIGRHEPAYYWGKNIQGYWEFQAKPIRGKLLDFAIYWGEVGSKGWHSVESTCLRLLWPGFKSWLWLFIWLDIVAVPDEFFSEMFFFSYPGTLIYPILKLLQIPIPSGRHKHRQMNSLEPLRFYQ